MSVPTKAALSDTSGAVLPLESVPSTTSSGKFVADMEAELLAPYTHVAVHKGKQVRKALIMAFQVWLGIPEQALATITEVITMLHNASLIIDDIEDNSQLRRGAPAAHTVYGVPWSLNAANLVYFQAMERIRQLGNTDAVGVMIEEMVDLHKGQGKDIYWRDTLICPTEDQYKEMVTQKTGGLFRLCVRLMQCFSTADINLVPLAERLGLVFQIRDDYVNLTQRKYMAGKGFCEDLREGKFSFPIIHALSVLVGAKRARLLDILRMRPDESKLKEEALDLMKESNSFSYTRQAILGLTLDVERLMKQQGGNAKLDTIVSLLGAGVLPDASAATAAAAAASPASTDTLPSMVSSEAV